MITTIAIEKRIEELHTTHTAIISMILELETITESVSSDMKDGAARNIIEKKMKDISTLSGALKDALFDAEAIARDVEQEIYRETYKSKVVEE